MMKRAVVTMLGALLAWASPASAEQVTFQSAATHDFTTGAELNGAGLLWRTRHEVWASLSPTGLDPAHGYSVWWVIFNNADECTVNPALPGDPACGLGDLFDPGVDAAVFYAGGFVSDANGAANVSVHLQAGDIAQGADVLIAGQQAGGGNGLNAGNGFGAEVHLILRSHEPAADGSVDEQIGSHGGLCGAGGADCEDQQAVAFVPNPPQ